jgi:16S rRNA A1518/A1519 N6-dimethyltransferase RsmA/KsgA/DIM1 with predicted DNA glycosylase/AP lyase activity
MLKNNLLGGLKIEAKIIEKALLDNNFDFKLRAEDLRLDDWLKLFASLEKFMI